MLPPLLLAIPRNSITAVGLPIALGLFSGHNTKNVVRNHWYKSLRFPPARPPGWVFPIVWPVLYAGMGCASHIAVKALDGAETESTRSGLSLALTLYYSQLALNCLWSPLFFGSKKIGWALVDSTALLVTTFYMTSLMHKCTGGDTTYLLLPYCAWLSYATYLNGGIWFMNRARVD
ncbi:TspO/MBR-related protein [Hygrophoropsis aurantiaca]|uniref:TspO/MBR-related protein n=1 Tax=Hygrophoropsis aurantiaca TaxID=72124 RepID=A0ACB8AMP7_9AGAM|nr:TspO/MBR-related protein [Hygrophoropsis aurantiaca]